MTDEATSEIIWGEPIEVHGKQPEWLGQSERWVDLMTAGSWKCSNRAAEYPPSEWAWRFRDGGVNITHIRLPADHPYYAQVEKQREGQEMEDEQGA